MTESIRARYRQFTRVECHEYSRLYAALAYSVADDDELLEFIAEMPDSQPNLFFASVQYLSGAEEMPATGADLKAFVREHRDAVANLMRTRRTQTNEIGRCATLLPALPEGPLALVEVGASGGLCLLLDRFRYDFGGVGVGEANSPVLLRCDPVGPSAIPIPKVLPIITWRRGLDINPIDVMDPEDTRWLMACVWADHAERRTRLENAIEMAQALQPSVTKGDLVDDLAAVLCDAPESATLVVFHSAVFPYVDQERVNAFVQLLSDFSSRREIIWVSNEGPGVIPWFDEAAPPRNELRFRLGRTRFCHGQTHQELLALGHYHGWSLEWLGGDQSRHHSA